MPEINISESSMAIFLPRRAVALGLVRGFYASSLPASPLVKTTGHIQHVFKWGVGNAFRSQSKNRFTPVHHARPKEVTIPETYFEGEGPVQFDKLNEQWEVFWVENHKLNAKPFPVKKFGVEESKREALDFWAKLREKGRVGEEKSLRSENPNVYFDDRMQAWVAQIISPRKNIGKPIHIAYSVSKHGVGAAMRRAEATAAKYATSFAVSEARIKAALEAARV